MQKNLHACVDEAICEVEQRLLEKGRESRAFGRDPLHALQLRAYPSELAGDPGDGGWGVRQAMVNYRYG